MEEVWVNIKDFPDYQISNFGRIESIRKLKSGKIIKKILKSLKINEYYYVALYKNKNRFYKSIHRLVLESFRPIDNSDNYQCNHIDGNKINNILNNLEWCTQSENMKHAYKIGLESQKGICNSSCKKTEDEIIFIIKLLNENILTQKEIGCKFGLSQSHISNIKNSKRWSHFITRRR